MPYFREFHGVKRGNKEFIDGVIAGITCYAVWKDGRQVVGVMETPLKEVVAEVKRDLEYPEEEWDARSGS